LVVEQAAGRPGRLGIYVDDVYRVEDVRWVTSDGGGRHVSVDRAFILFACDVGRRFGGCSLFGRTLIDRGAADYLLPTDVELVALPYYRDLFGIHGLVRALFGTVAAMWRGLRTVDVVWAFGPHPFAVVLVVLALLRRKRVVLGIRQSTMSYYRSRLPSPSWKPVLLGVWVLELSYRAFARFLPVTVVGADSAARYARAGRLLEMTVSLVPSASVAAAPNMREWSGRIDLITVGRIDAEKNPLLLIDALRLLERDEPGRYRLTWIGRGPLEAAVRQHAEAIGVAASLELPGYVPFGEDLLRRYRSSNALVHVSLTEGVPQVLVEALAMGLPIVATAVGGVASLLDGGSAGLLVPPNDALALVEAVRQLGNDAELRNRLASHGLAIARQHTLEAEAARTARFVAGQPAG
jgi:glycosyltransferase involved in cell wall biosynthesis